MKAGRPRPLTARLNTLTALTGGAMMLWYTVAGPALTAPGGWSGATLVAVVLPLLLLAMVGRRLPSARFLPYAAVAVGHALMIVAALRERSLYPWGGLVAGGTVLSALVLCRQALVQRDSDRLALTDALTGLANRARLRATSVRALERDARAGRHTAILVIDLNGFKEINDTLGHQAGDRVLTEVAGLLRFCVREPAVAGRLGGDEFAVVCGDLAGPEQAYELAGRIAAATAPVIVEGRLVTLSASIGVAVSAPGELGHDELVHRADLAMYRAKKAGPQTRWAVWRESDAAAEPAAGQRAAA